MNNYYVVTLPDDREALRVWSANWFHSRGYEPETGTILCRDGNTRSTLKLLKDNNETALVSHFVQDMARTWSADDGEAYC